MLCVLTWFLITLQLLSIQIFIESSILIYTLLPIVSLRNAVLNMFAYFFHIVYKQQLLLTEIARSWWGTCNQNFFWLDPSNRPSPCSL